ncbi:Dabb family protein [Geodermatophilus sabuli]|uniref:Dabb family protein n=1 Tax=Geodermatophilus sabuli TaxID=1564158 RepID=A0A7K3W1D6_9ACTN|nr:Dabb family protein [Geodermatophilus sabuli]
MFRHVVVFTWTSESTPEQREGALAALRQWGEDCREYGTLTLGVDAGLAEGNGNAVVVVDLPDRETYAAYAADERHLAALRDHVRPILERRCAVQHEL